MEFLLDTDCCISHMRGDHAGVLARLEAIAPARITLCAVVVAELLQGALISARPAENLKKIDDFRFQFRCLPFGEDSARLYADFYALLRRQGQMIGQMDLQIAAIAATYDLCLVTHNTKDFARIPGLRMEDWQA